MAARIAIVTCLALTVCVPAARAGTLVSFTFANFGSVQVDLFDDLTPLSAANLLQYINASRYNNTIVHRVDVGLGVIQAGGYNTQAQTITQFNPIALEYSRANTRGTIAMARTSNINSATSEWFINTDDNSVDLGQSNGGGYAVFGWVVGPGMGVVDAIAAVPTFAYASPFSQVPLTNFTEADKTAGNDPLPHLVVLTSATVLGTHPSFTNPFRSTDIDNNNLIQPIDALLIINDIIAHSNQQHAVQGPFSGTAYLDPSGDGQVGPLDAIQVINALIAQSQAAAQSNAAVVPSVGMASLGSVSAAVVPEPATWGLAAAGALSLCGGALARRALRRRGLRRASNRATTR